MKPATPLPLGIANKPFTLAQARLLGVGDRRLRAADLQKGSRGIYFQPCVPKTLLQHAEVIAAVTEGAWISHTTAAQIWGLWIPAWLTDDHRIHLSKPHVFTGARRLDVAGHHVRVLPGETVLFEGVPISTRIRTWLDLARRLPLEQLVCLGDQLIRVPRFSLEGRRNPYSSVQEMRSMVDGHRNLQGVTAARAALELMRVGSDSPPETLLRLALCAAGLEEPELQLRLLPEDSMSPSADMGFRRQRIALQYDGFYHLTREQQSSDNRRDHAFISGGWTYIKCNADDLANDFRKVVNQVRHALLRANASADIAAIRAV